MTLKTSQTPARLLFAAACSFGLGALAGCSTLSSLGAKTADVVSGAGAAVRDSVTGAPPAIAAPAGRRANETAPPRQPAATAPASAVGLGTPSPAPSPVASAAPPPPAAVPVPPPAPPPPPPPPPSPPPAAASRVAPVPVPAPRPAPATAPAPSAATAPRVAAAPAPAPAAAPRAAAPAPAKAAAAVAARPVTPGHYTVQIAAFAVAANAETTRDRVNARLAAAGAQLQPGERVAQVARIGDRSFVVVGDSADRTAAEDLARRLRPILNQDVAVIRM